jgi:hypothetical protein
MTLVQRFNQLTIWNKIGVVASICGIITFVVWLIPERSKPHPHFTLSLQIGDSPDSTVFLTNDFLFFRHIVKTGDLPNGNIMTHTFFDGCLVVPVQQGETNKIFNFIAQNDSNVKVTDFEASVGFPKEWKCGFDSKWHKVGESIVIPGAWEFRATNMQYVAEQSPWVLFPYDTLNFPAITNDCTIEYTDQTYKGGAFELAVRTTGFERLIAANIIFVPASSNFFKPFVTLGKIGTDGLIHLPITEEQIEKSQK